MKNSTELLFAVLAASLTFGTASSATLALGKSPELIRALPEHERCFAVHGVLAAAFEDAERLQSEDANAVILSLKVMAAELQLLEGLAKEVGCPALGEQFGRGANALLTGLRNNDFAAFEEWNQGFNNFKAEEVRTFQRELEKKGLGDLSANFEATVASTAGLVISSATAAATKK